jgi:hypothetical protein
MACDKSGKLPLSPNFATLFEALKMRAVLSFAAVCLSVCSIAAAQTALDDKTPKLGLKLIDAREAQAIWKESNLPARMTPKKGMLIAEVMPGSAPDRIGIQSADLLDKIGNRQIRTQAQADAAMALFKVNDLVPITIRRLQGTAWFPTEGKLLCSSPRMIAYSQLKTTGSAVTGTTRSTHFYLDGDANYISPILMVHDGKPSLGLEIRYFDDENWIHMQRITINYGGQKAVINTELFDVNSEVLDGARVRETLVLPQMPNDVEKVLRSEAALMAYRIDGKDYFREFKIEPGDAEKIRAVIAVYDDMVATKNTDLTLGGRIPLLK